MNLTGISRLASKTLLLAKHYSPEILMGAGIVGFVGTNILTSRATLKLEDELLEMRQEIDDLQSAAMTLADMKIEGRDVNYTERDYKIDLTRLYLKNTVRIVKLYAPSLIVGTLSVTALLGSHVIMHNRNVALMAAYQAVNTAFNKYRKNVQNDLGADADRKYLFDLEEKEVTKKITNKDGEEVNETDLVLTIPKSRDGEPSPYARFFDPMSVMWQKHATYNLTFLRSAQSYFNDLLRSRGHVFLNEVYDYLGIPRVREGQMVGWVYGKDGSNHIDFGIYDINNPAGRAFVNGEEASILLDFNVDGLIMDKITPLKGSSDEG